MPTATNTLHVAVIGAESTGKTTLIAQLASLLAQCGAGPVAVVNEVLRNFCERHGRTPLPHEQEGLIQEQQAIEATKSKHARVLLCDSAPLATALYSALLFQDSSLTPLAQQHHRSYQLTLVTWPDFKWQADAQAFLREGPTAQLSFHNQLLSFLERESIPYLRLQGTEQVRAQQAFDAIIALLR
jgi:nicotinamide riboside kinase